MKWYKANEPAPKGSYFNPYMWQIAQINGKSDEVLPGDANASYFKFPIWLSLITGPIGGIALVLAVPFAGIVGFIYFIVSRTKKAFSHVSRKRVVKIED